MNILDIIESCHVALSTMHETPINTAFYDHFKMPVEKKLERYPYPMPSCCTQKEFYFWLDGAKAKNIMPCFCSDCPAYFWRKKILQGKCNRPRFARVCK